jgi:hypothetical protein
MDKKELEVFSTQPDCAIVRLSGKKAPGVVVQGDTLAILFDSALKLVEQLHESGMDDAFEEALFLAEDLESRIRHYEEVLTDHKMPLPYQRDTTRSTEDYTADAEAEPQV